MKYMWSGGEVACTQSISILERLWLELCLLYYSFQIMNRYHDQFCRAVYFFTTKKKELIHWARLRFRLLGRSKKQREVILLINVTKSRRPWRGKIRCSVVQRGVFHILYMEIICRNMHKTYINEMFKTVMQLRFFIFIWHHLFSKNWTLHILYKV